MGSALLGRTSQVSLRVSKRLFIGLELPLPSRAVLAGLDPNIKGLKWLPVEQIHLTMSFLGEVDLQHEERLKEALAKVYVPPFFLPIQGVGLFGGTRPSVVVNKTTSPGLSTP